MDGLYYSVVSGICDMMLCTATWYLTGTDAKAGCQHGYEHRGILALRACHYQ